MEFTGEWAERTSTAVRRRFLRHPFPERPGSRGARDGDAVLDRDALVVTGHPARLSYDGRDDTNRTAACDKHILMDEQTSSSLEPSRHAFSAPPMPEFLTWGVAHTLVAFDR